ncbi:hypothetical protein [Streptomyces fractus]|uniref:hypothetical protein n=1 Tax=Streptomyces fractus TaxID=641806 RepID=UPI003CF11565
MDFTVIAAFEIGARELHVMVAIPGDLKDVNEQHDEPVMNEGLVPVWTTVAARTADEAAERFKELFWAMKADEL